MFLKFFDDKRKSCIANFKMMMMMMMMMMITGDKMRNSMIIIIKKNVAVSLIALKTFNENQNI
jgi:hypothetical protein